MLFEIIGWIGAGLIVLAYFLLTHHDLNSKSKIYQSMNLIGAIFLSINLFYNQAFPSFTLNIIWAGIAIYGFYKIFKK